MSEVGNNVCGVLVHAMPERVGEVCAALALIDGVEVHETTKGGRVIVTLEDVPGMPAVEQLAEIHRLQGVVAAALVYHQFEPDAAEGAAE